MRADANNDHHRVLARVKLKLCRERKGGRKLYDTAKLRDQSVSKKQLHIEIRNRFEALANNEDDSIEQDWLQLKKVYCESADAVLEKKRED